MESDAIPPSRTSASAHSDNLFLYRSGTSCAPVGNSRPDAVTPTDQRGTSGNNVRRRAWFRPPVRMPAVLSVFSGQRGLWTAIAAIAVVGLISTAVVVKSGSSAERGEIVRDQPPLFGSDDSAKGRNAERDTSNPARGLAHEDPRRDGGASPGTGGIPDSGLPGSTPSDAQVAPEPQPSVDTTTVVELPQPSAATAGIETGTFESSLTSLSQVSKIGLLGGTDFPSGQTIAIRSAENGKFVRAEIGATGVGSGMLRAGYDSAASSGAFTLVWNSSRGAWALRSNAAGKYVSDNDTAGSSVDWSAGSQDAILSAVAATASDWEMFNLYRYADGTYSFRAKTTGLYVAPELNYSGADYAMLRARSTDRGSWERLTLS